MRKVVIVETASAEKLSQFMRENVAKVSELNPLEKSLLDGVIAAVEKHKLGNVTGVKLNAIAVSSGLLTLSKNIKTALKDYDEGSPEKSDEEKPEKEPKKESKKSKQEDSGEEETDSGEESEKEESSSRRRSVIVLDNNSVAAGDQFTAAVRDALGSGFTSRVEDGIERWLDSECSDVKAEAVIDAALAKTKLETTARSLYDSIAEVIV